MLAVNFPYLFWRLPTDLAFTPLPLTIAMTLVVVVHVTYIYAHTRTHSHTRTHTRTLTERVCGAAHDGCVRRVYIGATWRGSQPTTAIHVAYIARRIYTAAWGGEQGRAGRVAGDGRARRLIRRPLDRRPSPTSFGFLARIGIQCCSFQPRGRAGLRKREPDESERERV